MLSSLYDECFSSFDSKFLNDQLVHHRSRWPPFTPADEFIQLSLRSCSDNGNVPIPFILNMTGDAKCNRFFLSGLAVIHTLYFSCDKYGDRAFQGSECDEVDNLLKIFLISFIECAETGAVHIQYAFHDTVMDQGKDDLGAG
jgi:hypothetical protein